MADIFIENTGTCDDLETALIRLKKTLTVILSSLDSKNIKKITTDKTEISSEDGKTTIDGTRIIMKDSMDNTRLEMGAEGESFVFRLKNKYGKDSVTLSDTGDARFCGDIETEKNASVGNNLYLGKTNNQSGTKMLQFYEDEEDDAKKAKIMAIKGSNGIVSLRIVADNIVLSTLDGVSDALGNRFISSSERDAYVTVNGVDFPVKFR